MMVNKILLLRKSSRDPCKKSHMDPATLLSVTGLVDLAQRFAWAFRSSDHHKTMHMADTPFFVSGEQYHTATASFISSYCSFPSPSLSAVVKT